MYQPVELLMGNAQSFLWRQRPLESSGAQTLVQKQIAIALKTLIRSALVPQKKRARPLQLDSFETALARWKQNRRFRSADPSVHRQ